MPLKILNPPTEVSRVVSKNIEAYFDRGRARGGGEALGRELTTPHQVFTLGLDDLTRAPSSLASTEAVADASRASVLDAARPTGWRYLVQEQGRATASAETVDVGGGRNEFSHFNEGRFVASSAAALETVKRLADAQSAELELRMLHIPALYMLAFWLHDEDTRNDLLVPLYPAPPGVEAYRPYPASELLDLLRTKASELIPDPIGATEGG